MATTRYSIAEWERLIADGVLGEDDRVELIRGEIVAMSPIGGQHVTAVAWLDDLLHDQLGRAVLILTQSPIRLLDDSEPQPDLAVVRRAYYDPAPPLAADVYLVIEVADSSLNHDRTRKLPLYAAAGIPEAWLFDLNGRRIERHTDPGPDGYLQIASAGLGQALTSTVLPAVTLSIDDVLPRPS